MARELQHNRRGAETGADINANERGPGQNAGKEPKGSPALAKFLMIAGMAMAGSGLSQGCGESQRSAVEDAEAQDVEEDTVEIEENAGEEAEDKADAEADEDAGTDDVSDPDSDVVEPETDAGPDADVGEVEADAYDCTAGTTRTEEERIPGPDRICDESGAEGSSQEIVETREFTEWIGPDCPESETERLLSYEIRVDPPIPEWNFSCAGSDMLGMPSGDEVIVSVSMSGIETANRIGDANLRMFERHNWGSGEYTSMLSRIVDVDTIHVSTIDELGIIVSTVTVRESGHTPIPEMPGMPPRGYLADNIDVVVETAHISYIETPVRVMTDGISIVTYEGRNYVFYMDTGGGEWHGIILVGE